MNQMIVLERSSEKTNLLIQPPIRIERPEHHLHETHLEKQLEHASLKLSKQKMIKITCRCLWAHFLHKIKNKEFLLLHIFHANENMFLQAV